MKNLCPKRLYVDRALALYRVTPGTRGVVRRADRRLAEQLYDQGIPLETIHAALLLALARRSNRWPQDPPLGPIATFHYFRPVIAKILDQPLESGYLDYLRYRLADLAPALTQTDHQKA